MKNIGGGGVIVNQTNVRRWRFCVLCVPSGRATVLVPRTLAPKSPRCQNALERTINAAPGNISARPGV
jgi:hypothetical protein